MPRARRIRLLLIGVGNVGRRFLELLLLKHDALCGRLGLDLVLAGVADRSGVAFGQAGLDAAEIVQLKTSGRGVADHPSWGRTDVGAQWLAETGEADLLLEASPANLRDGQPGLGCIEAALSRGLHVVTANKAPLVLAFPRLSALAKSHGAELRYGATVCGGLPAVNLGQRDLAVTEIHRLEGVVNLTANLILTRMADEGLSYEAALAEAQAAGHAESDPSLDVEGWDSASKLVILAHSVLRYPATLKQVAVEGITGVTPEMLRKAAAMGRRIKLLATAERQADGYRLWVGPSCLEARHPLAQLGAEQMGLAFHTDVCGIVAASIVEETPQPTAYAMLRDVVEITR